MIRIAFPLFLWIAIAFPCESKPVRSRDDSTEKDRGPVVVDHDVFEIEFREAQIPFQIERNSEANVRAVRLLVSEDAGKTWKLADERKPTDGRFHFRAMRDGLFHFAVQAVKVDGTYDPPDSNRLVADLKLYVNKDKRVLSRKPAP